MSLIKHIDKNNLHHAYLIEGAREEILPEVLGLMGELGVEVVGNPDFCHITLDSFKVEDARNLKSLVGEKSFSENKKVFIISANSFLLEAQNTMLKVFEEPIENTHFFVIVPDASAFLKTFTSRFYLIKGGKSDLTQDAEKFITLPLQNRIEFIKELLVEAEDEENISLDSTRSKALKFLNELETVLHYKIFLQSKSLKNSAVFTLPGVPGGTYAAQNFLDSCFPHLFKVREFLRMPGSSTKTLLESVALITPVL